MQSRIHNSTQMIAGRQVSVKVVRPLERSGPVPVIAGLIKGLKLTLGYFLRPSKIVTRQYPENRGKLKFPARYRASLKMIHDENGMHRCTSCGLCAKACPNGSISIVTRKGPLSGKNELEFYTWRQDRCVVCNACVQACPFGAIEMGHEFENAVYDRRLLVYNLNRYAGPPASVLNAVEDIEKRRAMMEGRGAYDGPACEGAMKEGRI